MTSTPETLLEEIEAKNRELIAKKTTPLLSFLKNKQVNLLFFWFSQYFYFIGSHSVNLRALGSYSRDSCFLYHCSLNIWLSDLLLHSGCWTIDSLCRARDSLACSSGILDFLKAFGYCSKAAVGNWWAGCGLFLSHILNGVGRGLRKWKVGRKDDTVKWVPTVLSELCFWW